MEAPFFVPSKRARAPNNSSSSQVASCMVDGCNSDLSKCREYHRRHKVCELHSKTPKVTIRGQEQRFCQQCSRFHSLVEFDDAKRSCRKRLDGHNRRRRKLPQPDTTSSINSSSSSSTHYLLSNSNYEVANYVTSTAFLRSGLVGSSCSWGVAPENRAAELVRSSSSSSNHQHHHQANNNTVSSSFSDKKFPSFPFAGGGESFKGGQIHFPNFLQGSPRQEPPVGPTVNPPFLGRVSCDRALSLLSSLPPPLPQAEAQTEAEASSRKNVASGAPPPPPDHHHHHQLNASLATQLGLLSGSGNATATATANNMLVSSSQGGMMFQVRRRLDDDESSGSGSRPLHYPPSFSWD